MNIRVLIVDHDQGRSKVLQEKLEKLRFSVTSVASSSQCFELLEADTPDVVLLETAAMEILRIGVEEMDGLQLLQYIRTVYSSRDIPVIMIADTNEVSDIVKGLKRGANDYVTRPINIEILEARIHSLISATRNYRDAIEKNEMESINALVATYNHEINNPLMIALGFLKKAKREGSLEYFDRIEEALQRVGTIIKEIEKIAPKSKEASNSDTTKKIYRNF